MVNDLVLLGRWAETPLVAYPGYCDAAQQAFEDRTGFRLEPFTLLRQGLHEQYYTADSANRMREWFYELTDRARLEFAERLYDGYYADAEILLAQFVEPMQESNLSRTSDDQLHEWIAKWIALPARLAGPIFFSLLIDVWAETRQDIDLRPVIEIAKRARDHCSNVYDIQAKREADQLFGEVAIRTATHPDDIQQLFPEEVDALLRGQLVDSAEKIAERRVFFVTCNIDLRYSILDGERAGEILASVVLAELGEVQDHLTGLAACAGKTEGRAATILSNPDTTKFMDGDILVAYQTSVWYEPLFDRAAAVLTELGGATSHAAVVCAERRIPCIVGVTNLIRSVSDGDIVSVDAYAGYVDVKRRAGI